MADLESAARLRGWDCHPWDRGHLQDQLDPKDREVAKQCLLFLINCEEPRAERIQKNSPHPHLPIGGQAFAHLHLFPNGEGLGRGVVFARRSF